MSKLQEAKKEYDDNWSAQATGYYLKELKKSNAEMLEALIESVQSFYDTCELDTLRNKLAFKTLRNIKPKQVKAIENAKGQKIEELITRKSRD